MMVRFDIQYGKKHGRSYGMWWYGMMVRFDILHEKTPVCYMVCGWYMEKTRCMIWGAGGMG